LSLLFVVRIFPIKLKHNTQAERNLIQKQQLHINTHTDICRIS